MRTVERPVLVVCVAVLGMILGQQMLMPVLPPLARELGLGELALGIIFTVSASGVVLVSPFWGRRGTVWGHRAVLLISLAGAAAGLLAFAVIAQIGLTGVFAVAPLFALILLFRGVVFGVAWAATPVTAQSYIADVTTGESARVTGMALVGAAQGLGSAAGPAIGGLLVFGGLLVPLYAAPVIIIAIAVLVWIWLPRPDRHREKPPARRVSPFESRMWPFLVMGFGMFLSFGVVLMTVGFLLQDRLALTAQETGQVTGLVMLAGAGAMLVVQAVIVPRLGWRPPRLMRTGAVVMTAGMATMTVAPGAPLIAAGFTTLGVGLGLGIPGYMAAPTLLADRDEQGAVAGLIGSNNALTFVFGPLVGTALYEVAPVAPYLTGTGLLLILVVFVLVAFPRAGEHRIHHDVQGHRGNPDERAPP